MKYNKSNEIIRCYNLEEILRLDLDKEVRENLRQKFGKRVFFDSNGSCKVGKLCGLEINYQLGATYYIISDANNKELFIPVSQSITTIL